MNLFANFRNTTLVSHERKGASRTIARFGLAPLSGFLSLGLSCPPARSCLQLTDLAFQFCDLLLLLLDRVKHGPEDWVVVNHQVAVGVFGNGFRNNFLQRLGAKTNLFSS